MSRMVNFKLNVLTVALIFIISIVSAQANANSLISNEQDSDTIIQESTYFREIFGLITDKAFVEEVALSYSADNKYGVALTEDEIRGLDERIQHQDAFKPLLIDYLNNVDGFAWLYIDQQKGGEVHVGLLGDLASYADVIAKGKDIYGNADQVIFHEAQVTEEELTLLSKEIFSQRDRFIEGGITIQQTSVNIPSQRVDVFISPFNQETVAVLQKSFPDEMIAYFEAGSVKDFV